MADKPYQEILGSVMYAQIGTRPDLSYAISTLRKYASNPGNTHWQALMHVLQYIKATLHYKITYGGDCFKDLWPTGWVDADYGGDINSCRSCAGYMFIQAGGPMAWSAQYQPMVALSTTEAKYMAVSHAAKQILWMYLEMDEVRYPQKKTGILYNNNLGAVVLTKNTKHNLHIKHIDIRHHFICEWKYFSPSCPFRQQSRRLIHQSTWMCYSSAGMYFTMFMQGYHMSQARGSVMISTHHMWY